jgi:hypothetical protein
MPDARCRSAARMQPLIVVLVTVTLVAQQRRAAPEIHLIPDGYVGLVTIAFRAANGTTPRREGAARLYEIPTTGILLTQEEPNVGLSPAWSFVIVSRTGNRTPVAGIWSASVPDTPENRAANTVEVFNLRRGRLQAGRLPCDVEYQHYFVGTRSQLLDDDGMAELRRLQSYLQANFRCR